LRRSNDCLLIDGFLSALHAAYMLYPGQQIVANPPADSPAGLLALCDPVHQADILSLYSHVARHRPFPSRRLDVLISELQTRLARSPTVLRAQFRATLIEWIQYEVEFGFGCY
jgi:hypothetical protein